METGGLIALQRSGIGRLLGTVGFDAAHVINEDASDLGFVGRPFRIGNQLNILVGDRQLVEFAARYQPSGDISAF